MSRVLLTDDESVALAAHWPAYQIPPLFTVDQADRDALVEAAARGLRSLIVRGLMTVEDGRPCPTSEIVRYWPADSRSASSLILYVALASEPLRITAGHFRLQPLSIGGLVVEAGSPSGIRELRQLPASEAESVVGGLCAVAREGKLGPGADGKVLVLALSGADGRQLMEFSADGIWLSDVLVEGEEAPVLAGRRAVSDADYPRIISRYLEAAQS